MNRREFLRLGLSASTVCMSPYALGKSSNSVDDSFSIYSASDNEQGLHQLSIYSVESGSSQHYPIPFRAHDILPLPDKFNGSQLNTRVLAFGRRPDNQCVMVNTQTSEQTIIVANQGRHFYGHGCLSADQQSLFTTENHYEQARGVIGIRDAETLQTIGEYESFGVGPHDIHLMPDKKTLIVANGGIETHPDFGRRKLNLDIMQPSLVYIDLANGQKIDEYRLNDPQLSIRHLSVSDEGDVGVATQFQGNLYQRQPRSLVAWQSKGADLQSIPMLDALSQKIRGYMADIAYDSTRKILAVTAPRGNQVTLWDTDQQRMLPPVTIPQPSGIQFLKAQQQFIVSSALGGVFSIELNQGAPIIQALFEDSQTAWDNHLVIA